MAGKTLLLISLSSIAIFLVGLIGLPFVLGLLFLITPLFIYVTDLKSGNKTLVNIKRSGFLPSKSFDLSSGCSIHFDLVSSRLALIDKDEVLLPSFSEKPELFQSGCGMNSTGEKISVSFSIAFVEHQTGYRRKMNFCADMETFKQIQEEWVTIFAS